MRGTENGHDNRRRRFAFVSNRKCEISSQDTTRIRLQRARILKQALRGVSQEGEERATCRAGSVSKVGKGAPVVDMVVDAVRWASPLVPERPPPACAPPGRRPWALAVALLLAAAAVARPLAPTPKRHS